MPATDSSSNGGAPSTRAVDGGREATIEGLTVAVGQLRRGVAALKAENRELRAEIARLEREATGRRDGDTPVRELATDSLRLEIQNPGAASV